jgi:hypothetical protein
VETQQLEMWFLAFFRSAIAMSERRIGLHVQVGKNQIVGEDRAQQTGGTEVLVYADEDFVA